MMCFKILGECLNLGRSLNKYILNIIEKARLFMNCDTNDAIYACDQSIQRFDDVTNQHIAAKSSGGKNYPLSLIILLQITADFVIGRILQNVSSYRSKDHGPFFFKEERRNSLNEKSTTYFCIQCSQADKNRGEEKFKKQAIDFFLGQGR